VTGVTNSSEVIIQIKEHSGIAAMLRDIHFRPNDVIHVHAEAAALAKYPNLTEGITR
jgi:hypothetical protein